MGRGLALANMILAVSACVAYSAIGDYRRSIYWGAAAVLTASVTF